MPKVIIAFLLCIGFVNGYGQTKKRAPLYLIINYNKTLSDITAGNNARSLGLGLQRFSTSSTVIKPTVELSADVYLMDDKLLRIWADGTPVNTVGTMFTIFGGGYVDIADYFYISMVGGPGFLGGQTLLGIKPSIGIHVDKEKQLTAKFSYINILNREPRAKQNFTSFSFSLAISIR
ncbi:MAG: hypothetical protein ACOVQE_09245 [Chitinophagaceae bacterium]